MRILPKIFKRPKHKKDIVKRVSEGKKTDSWAKNGTKDRYRIVFEYKLENHPLEFLERLKNKKPKVLFIGPGKGEYIKIFKEKLNEKGISPEISVIGIKKSINPDLLEEKVINRDYSIDKTMEDIFDNPNKYETLIKILRDNADLVIASKSSGFHTYYPAYNVFISALLLKPGGRTYIEIPTRELILGSESRKSKNQQPYGIFNKLKKIIYGEEDYENQIQYRHKKRMIREVENISEETRTYLNKYFKRDVSKEFEINLFNKSKSAGSVFVIVNRKSL